MTQSINKPFKANEAAKQVEQLKKSFEAPAVKAVKQGLVPAPKTSPATKRSGRVVGISKDENEFLYNLLTSLKDCPDHAKMVEDAAYTKLIGRYNK